MMCGATPRSGARVENVRRMSCGVQPPPARSNVLQAFVRPRRGRLRCRSFTAFESALRELGLARARRRREQEEQVRAGGGRELRSRKLARELAELVER